MNRVISIGDDVDPAIVITRHGSTFRIERCLDSVRHDKARFALTTDSAANCQSRHLNRGADNFPAS